MKYQARLASLLLLLFAVGSGAAQQREDRLSLDTLYSRLDQAIAATRQSPRGRLLNPYIEAKQERLTLLSSQYHATANPQSRYELAAALCQEYYSYSNDSALVWIKRSLALARQLGRKDLEARSMLSLAGQYGISGYYDEATHYLQQVSKADLDPRLLSDYYQTATHVYGDMGAFAKDETIKQLYYSLSDAYRDSLYTVAPPASANYLWRRSQQLNNARSFGQAMQASRRWEQAVKYGTHDYAIMAFFRSLIYRNQGNVEEQKRWLALSALCDIRNAIMDQSSLWTLAGLLSKEGDTERAYRYMDYSWSCVSFFGTHLRGWQVTPILNVINTNYRDSLQKANRRLIWLIALVSLLSVVLLGIIVYVQHKRSQLARTRNALHDINQQLEGLNRQLSDANERMQRANQQLSDANRMKDEYIGKFLSTCSEYIDKMDNYRIKVNRKLKAKQYADLLKMTESNQLKADEQRELFHNFDRVFLRLFPNFVNDFNALLAPQHHIKVPQEGQLTTDLRIFALIRLGINESSRIAEFLDYSPNSIYNYRARIKNKALCSRDDFERRVREIEM